MATVSKGQKMTIAQITDLINKLNSEANRRGVSTRVPVPSAGSPVSYSTIKSINDLRGTVAAKYRHAACSTVTCSTVRSDKTGTPTGWDGRDLTQTIINQGETKLGVGNKAYPSQYNLLLSDIEKLNAMCACNSYDSYSCSCYSEETIPCSANGCTSHPAVPIYKYCYCEPFTSCGCEEQQCQTQCSCNSVTCTCVGEKEMMCKTDGCYSVGNCDCQQVACTPVCGCDVEKPSGACGIVDSTICPCNAYAADQTCDCHAQKCSCNRVCGCNTYGTSPCDSHTACDVQSCKVVCNSETAPCNCQYNKIGTDECPGNCTCNTACGCQIVKTGECDTDGCYCNKDCVEYQK